MISGCTLIPFAWTSVAASKIARACISEISGNVIPSRQPRWPSMGLNSWSSCTRFVRVGENHFPHRINPVAFEEHMVGATEPNAFGPECDSVCHLLGCVGICTYAQRAEFIRPLHQLCVLLIGDASLGIERPVHEHLHNLRRRGSDFAGEHFASGSIDGNIIPSI